jgi:hypothetical protein
MSGLNSASYATRSEPLSASVTVAILIAGDLARKVVRWPALDER